MGCRPVFRVQCDGPCRQWLSRREDTPFGVDLGPEYHVLRLTAERAFNWPGEGAARATALWLGWRVSSDRWLCPECAANPLGIVLPPWPDELKGE